MNKRYVTEAAGLRKGNNRWRAIWRSAGPELRAKVSAIFQRELNIQLKAYYGPSSLSALIPAHPFFHMVPRK